MKILDRLIRWTGELPIFVAIIVAVQFAIAGAAYYLTNNLKVNERTVPLLLIALIVVTMANGTSRK